MKSRLVLASLLLVLGSSPASAGSLTNGSWQPSGCPSRPEPPTIDSNDVDSFNKSVAAINDWQQKSRDYFECLIKEANTDNAIIAETANQAQSKYRETVEKIGAAADAAKKKLDKQ